MQFFEKVFPTYRDDQLVGAELWLVHRLLVLMAESYDLVAVSVSEGQEFQHFLAAESYVVVPVRYYLHREL